MTDELRRGKRGHNGGSIHERGSDGLWVVDVLTTP
jgi:hypothetical protein